MKSAVRLLMAMMFLSFLQTACSVGGPSLQVQEARVVQQNADDVEMQIHIQARNDTDSPMRLLEYTYDVNVNGQQVYTGRRAALATLAAKSTTELMIPAVAPREVLRGMMTDSHAEQRYSVSGTLTFVEPGTVAKVLYDAKLLRPAQNFAGENEVIAASE